MSKKILEEKDMPKEILEEVARQEEMHAEVRKVYHYGTIGIIMECFHNGKSIGNIGMKVDGNIFSYQGPLSEGPPFPITVFLDKEEVKS